MTEPVQVHDLAEPEFTPEVQEIRSFMELMAADTPLDADVLHQKARDETGLDDFGSEDYRERFDLFLRALSEIDGLHGPGVLSFHMQLLQVLKNRLLMEQLGSVTLPLYVLMSADGRMLRSMGYDPAFSVQDFIDFLEVPRP